MKRLLAAQSGKGSPSGSAGYTANVAAELKQRCSVRSPRDWLDPAVQSAAFRLPLCSISCCFEAPVYASQSREQGRIGVKLLYCGFVHALLLCSHKGQHGETSDQSACSCA